MSTAAPALFALVESFFTEYLPRQRAAIRSFFKHLVRNDLAHSQQYTGTGHPVEESPAAAGDLPRGR
jgi:hypothetical protein